MPDIYLDVDAALSEVPVNIFPLTDDTDFKTRETGVAYNASGMDLVWNFVTSAGAFTQTAVTPTTGGVYDWTHQGDGMYTIEIPASGGASINNDTEGYGWFTGLATGVLPWRGPVIGFRHSAINDSLCDTNNTGLLAPTTAGRTVDVSAGGAVGLDFDNVELSNGQPKIGIFASGTLNGTHSSTTADLGTNAPSVDITGKILRIPVHGVCVMVDSYNTGTGVVTFSPATGATLANADAWYVDDSPLASTTTLPNVNTSTISNNAITAACMASDASAEIADAVWDEVLSGHAGVGSAGAALSAAGGSGDPWSTAVPGAYGAGTAGYIIGNNLDATISSRASASSLSTVAGYLDTEIAAILADTNELQTDWANGGRLDLILDARASQASVDTIDDFLDTEIAALTTAVADLPTNAELATALAAADDAVLAAISALNNLSAAQVNAEVLDVLNTDTFAEISSIPSATTTLTNMIRLIYAMHRNKQTQTATTFTLRNDADSGNIGTATVSDDLTTATRGELS